MSTDSFWIQLVISFNRFILYYLVFVNVIYTALFLLSIGALYVYHKKLKYWSYRDMINSSYTPPLSVIVPCYNEEKTIVDNVKALLSLEYGEFEVVIVNDGSKDGTMETLKENFQLVKVDLPYRKQIKTKDIRGIYLSANVENIMVIDKVNGGKADALNAGVNVCQYPLFTAIDADSIIERSSLLKVVRPFIEDPTVVVAGGVIRPVNGSLIDQGFIEEVKLAKNSLARFQTVEYLRAFLFGRMGWGVINSLLIVSGAFGVFNKRVVIGVESYTSDTIGEDMELIVKIHRRMKEKKEKYKIVFVPDPVCWTQVPEDRRVLKNQRMRWHKGLMDTVINHYKLIFNPKYGAVGIFAMPYFTFVEMLGSIIEVLGYIIFVISLYYGIVGFEFALVFLAFAILYGIFLSMGAILLEEYNFRKYEDISDYLLLIVYSVLENFGYRQMTTLWNFQAFWQYRPNNNKWGEMKRKDFKE